MNRDINAHLEDIRATLDEDFVDEDFVDEQMEAILDRLEEEPYQPYQPGAFPQRVGRFIGRRAIKKAYRSVKKTADRRRAIGKAIGSVLNKVRGKKAGTTTTRSDGKYTKQRDGSWVKAR